MLASPDVDTINDLDFTYLPGCEGETHSRSLHGHQAEEPARWVLVMPCCGPKLLVCEPRRAHIMADLDIRCNFHQEYVDTRAVRFIPITPET